jgi:predicted O-methyltransferase YrrM
MRSLGKTDGARGYFASTTRRVRSFAAALAERRRAARDREAVRRHFPGLQAALAGAARADLAAEHARYCREVSSDRMAASLELSVFLRHWCATRDPARAIDLGSGFTSYVLRRHRAEDGDRCEIWSVDDDPAWLERARAFVASHHLDVQHMVSWREFRSARPHAFDLVVHDAGSMTFRAETLDAALDLAAPAGLVVLDDVHKSDYRAVVLERLAARGLSFLSLRDALRDRYGRYAYAVFARRPVVDAHPRRNDT